MRYSEYWKTDQIIETRAQEIHGIDADTLDAQGIDAKEGLRRFSELCSSVRNAGGRIVAHNLRFDLDRIKDTANRNGITVPSFLLSTSAAHPDPVFLCTMHASKSICDMRTKKKKLKNPKNDELFAFLFPHHPMDRSRLHGALYDSDLTSQNFVEGRRREWW